MTSLTRRGLVQGLGAGALFGVSGCALNAGKVDLVETNAASFSGELEIAGGRLWLKRALGGPDTDAFILDTGAALSTLHGARETYNAREVGKLDVQAIGETTERGLVRIDPVPLGPSYALPSQQALKAVRPNPFLSSLMLGRYAFDRQVLDLDFQAETYRISTSDARNEDYPGAYREWTPGVRGGPIASNILIDGERTNGILDTGSPVALPLFPKFLKRYDISNQAAMLGPYVAFSGSTRKLLKGRYVKLHEVTLYNTVFHNVCALAVLDDEVPSPGLFGLDVLVGLHLIKYFKFTMDLIKRRRYLITPT